MIDPERWTERRWSFDLPLERFVNLLERVRGTPARAAALADKRAEEVLSRRPGNSWSAKEHIAHLDDLHELDMTRLSEFREGVEVLSTADMKNARTHQARHNETPMVEILERLRSHREDLVAELEPLPPETIGRSRLHPRLNQRMRLVDWLWFVAEHDDHHLARARRALSAPGGDAP